MIIQGDTLTVLRSLPAESVQMVCTSPPYWQLRNYGDTRQYGLERHPKQWLARQRAVCREIRRVLRKDGAFFLNVGDSYWGSNASRRGDVNSAGPKQRTCRGSLMVRDCIVRNDSAWLQPKQLLMLPARLAILLQNDGWILRNDICWAKRNAMPESVTDRCSSKHEHLFLFARSRKYKFRLERILQPLKESTIQRISQTTIMNQRGGEKQIGYAEQFGDSGNANLPHRIVQGMAKKQDGHGRRYAGFNERYFKGDGHARRQTNKNQGNAHDRIHEGGANPGDVWNINTQPTVWPGNVQHFATFPETLVERCVLAGSDEGDVVLDPYMGSGTVALVAQRLNRKSLGIELNPAYCRMAAKRLRGRTIPLALWV